MSAAPRLISSSIREQHKSGARTGYQARGRAGTAYDRRVTRRRYLEDSYLRELDTEVVACRDGWCRLAETLFHPGGGGQPCDRGQLVVDGEPIQVTAMREDDAGVWHDAARSLRDRQPVRAVLDWPYRHAVMRHHALLHVVNTIALRDFAARITGAQIGPERSRIDLQLADFSRERLPDLEARVNDVIGRDLASIERGGFALSGTVFEYLAAIEANARSYASDRVGRPPIMLLFVGDDSLHHETDPRNANWGGQRLFEQARTRIPKRGDRSRWETGEYNLQIESSLPS